jgi:hypothetical protein
LHYANRTETEFATEDWEEAIEEFHWPAHFRKDQDDSLDDYEQTIDNGPKYSNGLVRDGAVPDQSVNNDMTR